MAYSAATAAIRKGLDLGLYAPLGTAAEISKGGSIWSYCSSHASSDCGAVTGFFTGCGAQPTSNMGAASPNLARSSNNVGLRAGDLVVVVQSSAGNSPGLVSWHAVKNSTFNQGSTSASSAFAAGSGFDCTISSAASS